MTELKLQQCRLDGRYDIQDCLGRGSYAEIFIARDIKVEPQHPHSLVVIKALNVFLQGTLDEELERTLIENFQNEAVALDRVRHPNIINRLGHGTAIDLASKTFHYLVLEYLSGGDLAAYCREHPLPLDGALFYLEQVCTGLAHAHRCQVIHRDIKPHNLLLTADRQTVKIADFGVAKIEATEGAITRVGTNIYAAPEHNPLLQTGQLDSASLSLSQINLTPAADIYSLAKTAYTLIAGESPRRFAHHPITALPDSLMNKSWSSALLNVLSRATHRDPAQRQQTVQEFWDDLSDAMMPPTQLLGAPGEQPPRVRGISEQLTQVAEAPSRPRFDSTNAIIQNAGVPNGHTHPRIVVPVSLNEPQPAPPATRSGAKDILAAMSDAPHSKPALPAGRKDFAATRGARFLVALFLIIAFAGMLLATHNYFRGRINLPWTGATKTNPPSPTEASVDVGREGLTTTDVYLRPDPGTDNRPIGLAEYGSRVRVLSINNNWYEVQILQHGRARQDESLKAERGWLNKRYLNLDS